MSVVETSEPTAWADIEAHVSWLRGRDRSELGPQSEWAKTQYLDKYAWPGEDWLDTSTRVATTVLGALGYAPESSEVQKTIRYIAERKFIPGGRYLAATGRGLHQTQNCLLLRAEDTREGWAELAEHATMALMTGAGIGVDYSLLREEGAPVRRTGGFSSGPLALMKMVNEIGRNVMMGGSRRSAIWAGLNWKHPDIFKFITAKKYSERIRAMKQEDFNFPAPLDMTNISVLLDDEFFERFDAGDQWATDVYWQTVAGMTTDGEPGFSIDIGENAGETLRNACTEVTSSDDSDICNLGSINLARVNDIIELGDIVRVGILFLLAGTVYSHVPYGRVSDVREKNRRLGLGLMGIAEWLYGRGKSYGPDDELAEWLEVYAGSTQIAHRYADQHGLSRPIKTRAIAPNGTIGIIAETTTGIEPPFANAVKRRFLHKGEWVHQYVVDPTAKRLVEKGVKPWKVEDAYTLANTYERRIAMQAFVQQYVDHGIASTVNLPRPLDKEEQSEFGKTLYKYLPSLRGITCYPDGARGGQPLSAVALEIALEQEGVTFQENGDPCIGGVCGA